MSQTSSKYVTIGVLILLLLNTGLVIFLVVDRNRSHSYSARTRSDLAAQMAKELNMTAAQREQHLQFRENFYKETRPFYDSIRRTRVELFSSIGNTQQSDSLLVQCNEKINHWQNQINTRLTFFWEQNTAVDDQDFPVDFKYGHVATDLTNTA